MSEKTSGRKALKVLMLPSWYPPDGGSFFRDQARFVAGAGAEIAVAHPRPIWPRQLVQQPESRLLPLRGLRFMDDAGIPTFQRSWLAVPSRGRLDPVQTAYVARGLFRQVVRQWGQPDLIHAHSTWWGGYAAYSLWRQYGVPYVVTEHRGRFSLADDAARELVPDWSKPYITKALNGSRTVILVGSGLLRQLEPLLRKEVPVEIIPNGVDTSFFSPGEPFDDRTFAFVFVGALTRQKGVQTLVDAFGRVHREDARARLIIVGDGPERDAVKARVVGDGLGAAVELLGSLDAGGVRQALRRGRVCVLPSDFEGQPVSLLEAMAVGLPVIATRGAPPELFPSNFGSRVNAGDAASLAEAMAGMMRDYSRYESEAIRAFTVEQYDFRAVAQRVIEVYERCASGQEAVVGKRTEAPDNRCE